ncbi:MAG: ATP synthase F1 subunit epsilon [Leptospirales bacterium]|nr:ATP synthase F1 subunit epsilon [Leptospirales bacterium]
MGGKINCTVITPEKTFYDGEVDSSVIQTHDGGRAFLHNHTSFVAKLGVGEIRLKVDGSPEFLFVEGGVAEVKDNKVVILAERAFFIQDLDKVQIENALKDLDSRKAELAKFSPEREEISAEQSALRARLKTALR